MIEILLICLIVWIIYAWKTGKFKKEYQEKNNTELKNAWNELKQSVQFKHKNHIESLTSEPILSQKQLKKLRNDRIKDAENLAKKHGTKSQINDEKIKPKTYEDYEHSFLNDHGEPELEILYTSFNNPESYRKIQLYDVYSKKFDGVYYTYIDAYCFSSEDLRTFRLDRIEYVKDLNTGETLYSQIEIEKLFKKLRG